jgi:hypothetical protein
VYDTTTGAAYFVNENDRGRTMSALRDRLSDEFQAPEILFRPAGLVLDHSFECLHFERAALAVRREGDSAAIGMLIPLVRSSLTDKIKAILGEGGDEVASGERSKSVVIDRHEF